MERRITDPMQVPVQLNVPVPFEFREHLHEIARNRRMSLSQLCREALMLVHPLHKGVKALGDQSDAAKPQVPS